MYAYGAPAYVLTNNGTQLVAKFFDAFCAMLGAKRYLETAVHPQNSGQTERFKKNLVQRLRHYLEKHQRNWGTDLQPLT